MIACEGDKLMLVQFESVSKFFKNRITRESITALENITFEVNSGELILVSGKNGSGKSTLLRLVSQAIKPSSGTIQINELIKSRIRYCPDDPVLYQHVKLKKYLSLISKYSTQKDPIQVIDNWLENFDLLQRKNEPIRNLSRGMRYKVALITVLFDNPKLVVLDEPYSTLDDSSKNILSNYIVESQKQGVSFVLSDLRDTLDHNAIKVIAL